MAETSADYGTILGPDAKFKGDLSFDSAAKMLGHIEALRRICAARDTSQLILRLKEIVPEYNPSSHLLREVLGDGRRVEAVAG